MCIYFISLTFHMMACSHKLHLITWPLRSITMGSAGLQLLNNKSIVTLWIV